MQHGAAAMSSPAVGSAAPASCGPDQTCHRADTQPVGGAGAWRLAETAAHEHDQRQHQSGKRAPCPGAEHRAQVRVEDDEVHVDLLDPADGIAPGQAVVIYEGSRVVGSATIAATERAA